MELTTQKLVLPLFLHQAEDIYKRATVDEQGTNCAAMASEKALDVTLESLRQKMADFARERDWDQFHSPRNLLLALMGEVGELSEIFQWKGEVPKGLPGWGEDERQHLGEELSDVLLYLVRLSDICGVDLGSACLRKMELNARKYPAHLCRGSSRKHTHYSSSNDDPKSGASGAADEPVQH